MWPAAKAGNGGACCTISARRAHAPGHQSQKPGKLTDEEFTIIKSHPVRGHEMLLPGAVSTTSASSMCAAIITNASTGSGYPDKARRGKYFADRAAMSAVCDVYDGRHFRTGPTRLAGTRQESVARMASWQGHFDATVLQNLRQDHRHLPRSARWCAMASGKASAWSSSRIRRS